jgi:hypothetical protein
MRFFVVCFQAYTRGLQTQDFIILFGIDSILTAQITTFSLLFKKRLEM